MITECKVKILVVKKETFSYYFIYIFRFVFRLDKDFSKFILYFI